MKIENYFKNIENIGQREVIPGYKARFIHSKNMTFAYWEIKKDAILPQHSHMHEQVANLIEGIFELKIGNETKQMKSGDVAIIPSNTIHSGKAITNCKIIDCFYPIRGDYLK